MMTTRTDSFDRSPAGAFVESRAGVRNIVPLPGSGGGIDPIIFIIGSVRNAPLTTWKNRGGIGWSPELVSITEHGNMHYNRNPGSFAYDLEQLEAILEAHENFDYRAVGKNKPNWRIWLWQPRAMHILTTFFMHFVDASPFPGEYDFVLWHGLSVNSSRFLTAHDYPDRVPVAIAQVYAIPVEVVDFRMPVVESLEVVEYVSGSPGMIAVDYPSIGQTLRHSQDFENSSWRQRPQSLIPAWEAVMGGYDSLNTVYRNRAPQDNHTMVYMKIQLEFHNFLIEPFVSGTYNRRTEDIPSRVVQERMRDNLQDDAIDLRISTGNMNSGGRWLSDARSIIQNRMR